MNRFCTTDAAAGFTTTTTRVVFLVVSFIYVCLVFCILAHPLVAYDLKWLYGGGIGVPGPVITV